jgi:hypothetical protein
MLDTKLTEYSSTKQGKRSKMIPAHKLKQLRKQVKGDHKRIADIADVTVETVSRVLNGVWMNKTVIEAAITVRDEKQAEMDALAAKI